MWTKDHVSLRLLYRTVLSIKRCTMICRVLVFASSLPEYQTSGFNTAVLIGVRLPVLLPGYCVVDNTRHTAVVSKQGSPVVFASIWCTVGLRSIPASEPLSVKCIANIGYRHGRTRPILQRPSDAQSYSAPQTPNPTAPLRRPILQRPSDAQYYSAPQTPNPTAPLRRPILQRPSDAQSYSAPQTPNPTAHLRRPILQRPTDAPFQLVVKRCCRMYYTPNGILHTKYILLL